MLIDIHDVYFVCRLAIVHNWQQQLYQQRTSMLKVCIFPKSVTKLGRIFKSRNCADVLMHM